MSETTNRISKLSQTLTSYETARNEILAGRASSISVNGRTVSFFDLAFLENEIETIERKIKELSYGITSQNRFDLLGE